MSTIWVPLSPIPVEFDTWRTNREWTTSLDLRPKDNLNQKPAPSGKPPNCPVWWEEDNLRPFEETLQFVDYEIR